jgi:2-polyprenyl-6-methoxyphenol hydroxylase-like FAD-dependent oxidoreductase
MRKAWEESNNGSFPLEAHMRQSQVVFERVLKPLIQKNPLVEDYWGYTFESLVEQDDHVLSTVIDPSGKPIHIKSRYVIGCDGAGSKVRMSVGIEAPRTSLSVPHIFLRFLE